MLDHDLDLDSLVAARTPHLTVPPVGRGPEDRFDPDRCLTSLGPNIASWHRRPHQGGSQVIIRFKNDYGAIISEYRLLAGIYEILLSWPLNEEMGEIFRAMPRGLPGVKVFTYAGKSIGSIKKGFITACKKAGDRGFHLP